MKIRESKPWGFYRIIEDSEDYKIKYLYVSPNKRLSLQTHEHRAEHWVIISGVANVVVGDFEFKMKPGDSIKIEKGQAHRISAGDSGVEFIEVQTGTYFGEDDIKRIEDDYGRA
jgi:mannose-6-phosphate isomerase-like protein (cupin superfamily)